MLRRSPRRRIASCGCATAASSRTRTSKGRRVRLFSWFILRRLFHEPLRSITTALGIALGVGVIVAIQLTNASSLAGFQTALDTVSGRASLEVVGTGLGVDERRLPELGWLREYGEVAPIIEGDAVLRQSGHPS